MTALYIMIYQLERATKYDVNNSRIRTITSKYQSGSRVKQYTGCATVHWTSHLFRGTRKTRSCLTGRPKLVLFLSTFCYGSGSSGYLFHTLYVSVKDLLGTLYVSEEVYDDDSVTLYVLFCQFWHRVAQANKRRQKCCQIQIFS